MIPSCIRRLFLALPIGLAALGVQAQAKAQETVTIFAAASLKTALDRIVEVFPAEDVQTRISYGGSSSLARQIQFGAPADLFLSANAAWMDALASEGLVAAGSRHDLLTNQLVLVAGPGVTDNVRLEPGVDLQGPLNGGRLAMALVDAVPAGIYGREALQSLGAWDAVRDQVAQADNVRAALMLVASGEAPLGIVYATDALADPRVRVVAPFPQDSHGPIVYPVALVAGRTTPAARALLDFLRGPQAAAIFRAQGFGLAEDER